MKRPYSVLSPQNDSRKRFILSDVWFDTGGSGMNGKA